MSPSYYFSGVVRAVGSSARLEVFGVSASDSGRLSYDGVSNTHAVRLSNFS